MKLRMRAVLVTAMMQAASLLWGQTNADLRSVNGVTVDVSPVRRWLAQPGGERPMPHWKQVRIVEIKPGHIGGYQPCSVLIEETNKAEVLLANMPAASAAFFSKLEEKEAPIRVLRARIEVEEKKARDLFAASPPITSGPTEFIEADMEQRRPQVESMRRSLADLKAQLAKRQAEYDAILRSAPEVTTVLAMFTGRELSRLQIWDCGAKRGG